MAEPATNGAPVRSVADELGRATPDRQDPAWQPPTDPLKTQNVRLALTEIHREIPLSVVITGWDVPGVRAAKSQLVIGLFEQAAQMWDAMILSDSRIQSGLASRLSILGRPISFNVPRKYRDSRVARECKEAFEDSWREMATESAMGELLRWSIGMGFGVAQILWDTSGEYAIPQPLVWHPKYTYYHWLYRCYIAITMDGQEPITPGDGSWILHAPGGSGAAYQHVGYRAWMRGALGPVSPWWLGRSYALRDWMRYSERHGLPIIKLKTPAVGDPYVQAHIRFQMSRLGQETVLHLPQHPDPAIQNEVDLLEAKDTAHEGFRMLIEQCNQEITLALLAQTLTTSMPAEGGSSYAAARVHAGVLQGLQEADARALALTIYQQLSRPFAAMNFGDPDIAPRVVWDVTPFEDAKTKALAFMQLAEALNFMRVSGFELDPNSVRRMIRNTIPGFDPGPLTAIKPLAVETASIGAKAKAQASEGKPEDGKPNPDARARIGAVMQRIDPRLGERGRIAAARFESGEDEGLREAMAEIEAAMASQRRQRT